MRKKTQILFIQGGMTFKRKRDYLRYLKERSVSIEPTVKWSGEYLEERLGARFQVIRPRMPLKENAQYREWVIAFERYIPYLRHHLMLIGNSLGGIFLAKYLSEHRFPKTILATYLVCPPFDDTMPKEDLVGGFTLRDNLSRLEKNAGKLRLLFAKNDDVVPVSHAKKYAAKLPNAKIVVYRHIEGHFQVAAFPEIVAMIKRDAASGRRR